MKKNPVISWRTGLAIAAILAFAVARLSAASPFQQWGSLDPGPHAVGFRVLVRFDHTRTFGPPSARSGKFDNGDHARPLQLSVWYPAQRSDTTGRMSYEEYVGWIGQIGKRCQPNDETRAAGKEEFFRYFIAKGVRKEKLEQLMRMTTAAELDAGAERGVFPLIVFAPGIGESPVMHTILCEYLASHGYVVASLPSMGWESREMLFTGACVETQARDLEAVIALMREQPNVDMERIGIVGFSLGSCASLVVSMRDDDILAAVSLDGSIGFKDRIALMKMSPFFDPSAVRIPLLHVNIRGNKRNDMSILDSMKYSLRYTVGIRGIGHVNFTSLGMIAGIVPGFWKAIEQNARLGYETICRYTLDFLDAHVRDNVPGLAAFRDAPAPYIVPPGFVSVSIDRPVTRRASASGAIN